METEEVEGCNNVVLLKQKLNTSVGPTDALEWYPSLLHCLLFLLAVY